MRISLCSNYIHCMALIARSSLFKAQMYACRRVAVLGIRRLVRNFSSSTIQDTKLDRRLRRLDQDVRRMGRVSRRELEEAVEELKTSRSATSVQSFLLIRCCGSLLPEEPAWMRTQLVEDVWKMLQNLGVVMDISHYNALLQVYLENDHKFSPTEFLGDLERKGIEPNRVTYQRLVERYCLEGDIEGATHILEFMQGKQLPINEYIFNSLILGHSQVGDMKSAADMLNVMKHAGLETSSETYTTLLCGYAKHGDIEYMRSTLELCKKNDVQLLDRDYMELVYTLAINDHYEHVDEIIVKFQHTVGFNQDAFNLILRLTNKKKIEVAKKILFTMSRGVREGQLLPSGNFFIKQLVKTNCPIEETMAICEELKQEGLNDRGLLVATETSLLQGNRDNASVLLSSLKKQGYSIRQHYFWPLIVSHGKTGNPQGILDILRTMQEEFALAVPEETLREYAIPWLFNLYSNCSPEDLISKLRSVGIPLESSALFLVHYLLSVNNLPHALLIAHKHRVNYIPGLLRKALLQAYQHSGDATSFAGMLHVMYKTTENIGLSNANIGGEISIPDRYEMIGQVLIDALAGIRKDISAEMKKLLEAVNSGGFVISNSTAERLEEKLGSENLTAEISNLLEKLTNGTTVSQKQNKVPSLGVSDMNEMHLKNVLKYLNAKGKPTDTVKKQLLNLYCRNRNLKKVDAMWQELQQDGSVMSPRLATQLIDLYVASEKLEKALNVVKWSQNHLDSFVLSRLRTIKLATLCVRSQDVEGALNLLEEQSHLQKPEESPYALSSVCRILLNHLADEGDVENLDKMFDSLCKNGYMDVTNNVLGPLIKVHIVRNDLDSAMKQFEKLSRMYHCTPLKNEIMRKFIETEDAASLQKITDLSTSVHGEVNSLYDLVFAFVECGRIRQARKILETPGLLSRPQRVQLACKHYSQEGMVSTLEGLMEAAKSLSHIDSANIYKHLLMTYCKMNDAENAKGLWVKMQEENLQPTDEFLIILGNFLKKEGLPVPFAIPCSGDKEEYKGNENILPDRFISALGEKRLIVALNIFESMDDKTKHEISRLQLSSLLEELSKSDRHQEVTKLLLNMLQLNMPPIKQVFKTIIEQIASTGDVLTLQCVNKHLSGTLKRAIVYDNNLCHAHVVAGKAPEYLNILEKEIDDVNHNDVKALAGKFPKESILFLLKELPELHHQYHTICEKYFRHGIIIPFNMLWVHYALEHQYSAADNIWNQYLFRSRGIKYDTVSHFAVQHRDLPLATYVVDRLKESIVETSACGYAYSCVVDILVSTGKLEEAVQFAISSKAHIPYDDISKTVQEKLKNFIKEERLSLELCQQTAMQVKEKRK